MGVLKGTQPWAQSGIPGVLEVVSGVLNGTQAHSRVLKKAHAPDGATAGTAVVGVSVGVSAGGGIGTELVGEDVGKGAGEDMGEDVGKGAGEDVGESVGNSVGEFVVGAGVGERVGECVVGTGVPTQKRAQRWTARPADASTLRVPLRWSQCAESSGVVALSYPLVDPVSTPKSVPAI
jgi:hypothetical protein